MLKIPTSSKQKERSIITKGQSHQHDLQRHAVQGAKHEESFPERQRGDNVILFSNDELVGVQTSYDDVVVISMTITNYNVKIVLVDNGSPINYYSTMLSLI